MNRESFASPRCPGSLKEGFSTYNPSTLRHLFLGKRVFHVLPDPPIGKNWDAAHDQEHHFGNQQWYRMKLLKNIPVPDPHGGWLLKTDFPGKGFINFPLEQAANEHVCLQIASQVYGIVTVPNALIFFPDGQPAIITRYIGEDVPDDTYVSGYVNFQELSKKHYKELSARIENEYSFQHLVVLIEKHVAASLIVKERFFIQTVFSWLVGNAHAYMKNFALVKTTRGDYDLAPLENVKCTLLHETGPELGAPGGLFHGDRDSPEFREYGHYTRNEFQAFAARMNLLPQRTQKILDKFVNGSNQVSDLISKAFLPDDAKNFIKYCFWERVNRLK